MYRSIEQIRTVGVMGFGRAGAPICECLAECEFDVLVTEPDARAVEIAWEAIRSTQRLLISEDELTAEAAEAAVARIRVVESIEDLAAADL